MKTRLFALVLAGTTSVAALLTPAVAETAPAKAAAPAGNGVAADVNGEKIHSADLNRMMDSVKESEPSLRTNTPAAQKNLADLRVQMLDELIATRLLSQEAKRQKITIPQDKVDAAVTSIKKGFKTDAEFQTWLKQDNKTPDDLRRVISDELAIRELSTRISSDVTVSNDDIATFCRKNIDAFTIPEGVKARHILLAVNPNSPQSEKDRVRQRAVQLVKQLKGKSPSAFADAAKNNTDDVSTRGQGGDLGAFPRGKMDPAFEAAAFAAKVNEVVGPVESAYGLHIIQVYEKIPAKVLPLADVQKDPDLKAYLLKQKVEKKLDDAIAALKSKAKIQKYA